MAAGCKSRLCRDLDQIFGHGTPPSGDRALLDRFLVEGDQAAFEMLVARHGPMVRGVCRRILASPDDADDAFQATFLILVRKAGRLRDAERLGPWLYGVASRVAIKARSRTDRPRGHRVPIEDCPSRDVPDADLIDVRPILDAELGMISPKLRDVLVLCLLEGATVEEASRQLGCPTGTVKSRLARGREALRARLTGRGVAPGVALTAASASAAFASPVSASLTRATLNAVAGPPAGLAPGVAALTRGVAPTMIPRMTLTTSLLLGGIALAGLGTATWLKAPALAQQPGAAGPRPGAPAPADPAQLRQESMNHVKQILLAFHNYHDTNGRLPPAAIHGPDGLPKLSWRVALLPYLEDGALYNEFHLDEPWDSPHNKALIPRMPAVFATPDSPAPAGQSRLRGFMGKGALFEGAQGLGFQEVTDGTSNTVLIAAAREPVPWTQPSELIVTPGRPLPALDESDPSWCLAGMADGAALYLPTSDQVLLAAAITRAGGEVISWPVQPGRSPAADPAAPTAPTPPRSTPPPSGPARTTAVYSPPAPGAEGGMMAMMGGGAPPTTAGIELRLQRLEEKLDRLMQRLDAQAAGEKKP